MARVRIFLVLLLVCAEQLAADTVILRSGRRFTNAQVHIRGGDAHIRTNRGRVHVFPLRAVYKIRFANRAKIRRKAAGARGLREKRATPGRPAAAKPKPAPRKPAVIAKPAVAKAAFQLPHPADAPSPPRGLHPLWAMNPFISPLLFAGREWWGALISLGKLLISHRLYWYSRAITVEQRNQANGPGANEFVYLLAVQIGGPLLLESTRSRLRDYYVDPFGEGEVISRSLMRQKRMGALLLLAGITMLDYKLVENQYARARIGVTAGEEGPRINLSARFRF